MESWWAWDFGLRFWLFRLGARMKQSRAALASERHRANVQTLSKLMTSIQMIGVPHLGGTGVEGTCL